MPWYWRRAAGKRMQAERSPCAGGACRVPAARGMRLRRPPSAARRRRAPAPQLAVAPRKAAAPETHIECSHRAHAGASAGHSQHISLPSKFHCDRTRSRVCAHARPQPDHRRRPRVRGGARPARAPYRALEAARARGRGRTLHGAAARAAVRDPQPTQAPTPCRNRAPLLPIPVRPSGSQVVLPRDHRFSAHPQVDA